MNKGLSPHEAKRLIHEIEFAKSRNFYAEQNRRANAKALYEAESRAHKEYESRERRRGLSFTSMFTLSIVLSLFISILNEFINFNDLNFFYNFGGIFLLSFLGTLFGEIN